MPIPEAQEFFYVLEMLQSKLIDYSHIRPWADKLIQEVGTPPSWLRELTLKTHPDDLCNAIFEYFSLNPSVAEPCDMDKFHVACLYLRHERRELSWATFLRMAGEHLDRVSGDWACETPYHYLNVLEDECFSAEAERQTKEAYLADQDLRTWIDLAREKFEPFKKIDRVRKAHL